MKRPIFYISILVAIVVLVIISRYHLIGYRIDNVHKISTITIERFGSRYEQLLDELNEGNNTYRWRLIADPPPDEDLVVIIGRDEKPDDWYDYVRQHFIDKIRNRYSPPCYVVIGKSNQYSQTYETRLSTYYGSNFPLYINSLPSVSVVGKGIEIDTDTLTQTLPTTTYGGHLIPKGHKFLPYRVGNLCGIDKNGKLLKRKTRISKK